jgi:membrane-bound metal-dependent hydrolase YbcI (DUF457 family)
MREKLQRLGLGIALAIVSHLTIDMLYSAVFLVHFDRPTPPLHAPAWLEPMQPVARLLCDLIPSAVLGFVVASYAGLAGFCLSLVMFYCSPLFLNVNEGFYYSADGFAQALTIAILWALGAIAGHAAKGSWMPNTSFERTRGR